MSTTNISIRMDEELKRQAEALFNELGLNMTTAFNIFAKQAVRQQRIPFDIALDVPNADTMAAMRETEKIASDPSVKGYKDVHQMFEEILSDV